MLIIKGQLALSLLLIGLQPAVCQVTDDQSDFEVTRTWLDPSFAGRNDSGDLVAPEKINESAPFDVTSTWEQLSLGCGKAPLADFGVGNGFDCRPEDMLGNLPGRPQRGVPRAGRQRIGLQPGKRLISGGYSVKNGEFPSFARLEIRIADGETRVCSGTLISQDRVLTAAHCLYSTKESAISSVTVKLGLTNSDSYELTIRSVGHCFMPDFNPDTNQPDVAVLVLKGTIQFSDHIQPACVATREKFHDDAQCFVVGIGKTSPLDTSFNSVNQLPVKAHCDKLPNEKEGGTSCFASNSQALGELCQGDNGGPVYCIKDCDNDYERTYVVAGASTVAATNCTPKVEVEFQSPDYHKLGPKIEALAAKCVAYQKPESYGARVLAGR